MLVVAHAGGAHVVISGLAHIAAQASTTGATELKNPNPILPVVPEILWGAGSFLLLFVLLRVVAYPRLQKGVDARNAKVRGDREAADKVRAEAAAKAAQYEAQMADYKAQAAAKLDAARVTLEQERAAVLGPITARIAEQRTQAADETETAKRNALSSLESAVLEVASAAAERVLQRPVDQGLARRVVSDVVNAGVAR